MGVRAVLAMGEPMTDRHRLADAVRRHRVEAAIARVQLHEDTAERVRARLTSALDESDDAGELRRALVDAWRDLTPVIADLLDGPDA
jgi:hypothetical protein